MGERWVTLGVVFMGLGGVAAGLVGVGLPEGRRLGALFALIAGAGAGVMVLGLGSLADDSNEPSEFTFFLGSVLGFVVVCVALWLVWARARASGDRLERVDAPPG